MYHDLKKVSTCLSQHGNPYRLTGYTKEIIKMALILTKDAPFGNL